MKTKGFSLTRAVIFTVLITACAPKAVKVTSTAPAPGNKSLGPTTDPAGKPKPAKPNTPEPLTPQPPVTDRPAIAAGIPQESGAPVLEPKWISAPDILTGCYAWLPAGFPDFTVSTTADDDTMLMASFTADGFEYSSFTVKPAAHNNTGEPATKEQLLTRYLEYFENVLSIQSSRLVASGLTIESDPGAIGMEVAWEDTEGSDFQVSFWTNGTYIGVQMISGKIPFPYTKTKTAYLSGFRFKQ